MAVTADDGDGEECWLGAGLACCEERKIQRPLKTSRTKL